MTSLFSNRGCVLYLVSRVALMVATQVLMIAVGWHLYEITGKPLALGFSGLALFLPGFVLALPGGHVADVLDRRKVLVVCNLGVAVAAIMLSRIAESGVKELWPIYAILVFLGATRAFSGPAGSALMPNLVPKQDLERAVAFGSSAWQLALIAGPSLGGVLYAAVKNPAIVYAVCGGLAGVASLAVWLVPPVAQPPTKRGASWTTLVAGIHYVWSNKPILAAISLDLFAVLLGGAVALLPIFAKDILHVGTWGFGLLRSAPAVGAALTALAMTWLPMKRRAGTTMLVAVFLFGLATMGFAYSRSFGLSLVLLFLLGATDMFSVVVRQTLIQVRTPDEMRGRVSAVNLVFIGASNELGEFESGVTAAWLGPELAVLFGGIGTCLVVLVWAFVFPQLRRIDRLDEA